MNMKKSLKIILILSAFLISVLLISALIYQSNKQKFSNDSLIEASNIVEENGPRKLTTKIVGTKKVLTNIYDSYSLELPKSWDIPKTTALSGHVSIYHPLQRIEVGVEHEDVPILTVQILEKSAGLFLSEWIQRIYGGDLNEISQTPYLTYKSNLEKGISEDPNQIQKTIQYLISGAESNDKDANTIYTLICRTSEEEFQILLQECEEVVKTFKILN
ncbi:hypothetical protein KKH05_02250 [Patescibacteria group bacterium]|nr:hypothetical protein [Patescibacteria group bacterium]